MDQVVEQAKQAFKRELKKVPSPQVPSFHDGVEYGLCITRIGYGFLIMMHKTLRDLPRPEEEPALQAHREEIARAIQHFESYLILELDQCARAAEGEVCIAVPEEDPWQNDIWWTWVSSVCLMLLAPVNWCLMLIRTRVVRPKDR